MLYHLNMLTSVCVNLHTCTLLYVLYSLVVWSPYCVLKCSLTSVPRDVFLTLQCFCSHISSFSLSAAQPKLKIGESVALSRISVRSLCLCATDNSSAVLPLKLFPLKLPLCSGCIVYSAVSEYC